MVPPGRGELIVRLVRSASQGGFEGDESLGTAVVDPATGTGVLATVFVDRVERLAGRSDGDFALLLGRAMAHEIGHLLIGRTAHNQHRADAAPLDPRRNHPQRHRRLEVQRTRRAGDSLQILIRRVRGM
jgi:hypothetical protein